MADEDPQVQRNEMIRQLAELAHQIHPDRVETLLFEHGMPQIAASLRLDRQLRSAQS